MTIQHIQYTSRKKAESLPGDPSMAILSITDPTTPPARLSPEFSKVLRLSFFDAIPADEFLPAPIPGLFDQPMARQISGFISELHGVSHPYTLMVHCEYGVSRSAAVALFAEAMTQAPLAAREYTHAANPWVIERLLRLHPELDIEIPSPFAAIERRQGDRI